MHGIRLDVFLCVFKGFFSMFLGFLDLCAHCEFQVHTQSYFFLFSCIYFGIERERGDD